MRLGKAIFLGALAVALAAYAFDCAAATTPEQAMQCCNSMACSSHGHHAQDCCKAMQAMHAPFVQPSSVHGVSYSPVVVALLSDSDASRSTDSSTRIIRAHCHAPPIGSFLALMPLRI